MLKASPRTAHDSHNDIEIFEGYDGSMHGQVVKQSDDVRPQQHEIKTFILLEPLELARTSFVRGVA